MGWNSGETTSRTSRGKISRIFSVLCATLCSAPCTSRSNTAQTTITRLKHVSRRLLFPFGRQFLSTQNAGSPRFQVPREKCEVGLTKIQILDYGSGNLFSIENALKRSSGAIEVKVSSKFRSRSADGLILPGVGSFSSAQKILSENKKAILEDVRSRKLPLLGICLGMQLLFEESEEGPGDGLKLFKGKVRRFRAVDSLKIPHMGWNTFHPASSGSNFCKGLRMKEWAYYVHSYFPAPQDGRIVKAWTRYGNEKFPAIIESGRVFGTQFHPEKSQASGAKLISNFVSICENTGSKGK